MLPHSVKIITIILLHSVSCVDQDQTNKSTVRNILNQCLKSPNYISCFENIASKTLQRYLNSTVNISEGISLTRNDFALDSVKSDEEYRSINTPSERLTKSLRDFLKTHTLKFDLTDDFSDEEDEKGRAISKAGGIGGGGGGLGFGGGKKVSKKERKYMQYAFMVLLGIFGLTGPLVMKTLAVMAAKALIASKVALIIVGSVALKKIFEKDSEPAVKVHTVTTDDDHDRVYNAGVKHWSSYDPYHAWY